METHRPESADTALDQILQRTRVREVMRTAPLRLPLGTRLGDVVDAMRTARSSYALICADDQLVGLFNERDYLDKIAGNRARLDETIDAYMSAEPRTIGPDASVRECLQILLEEGGYRHLPVVEEGEVCGIVTARDIVQFIAELYPTEVHNLPPDPNQILSRAEGA